MVIANIYAAFTISRYSAISFNTHNEHMMFYCSHSVNEKTEARGGQWSARGHSYEVGRVMIQIQIKA